jgi:hypothetical protein
VRRLGIVAIRDKAFMVNIPLSENTVVNRATRDAATNFADANQKFMTSSKSPKQHPLRYQIPPDVNLDAASCHIGKIRI